MPEIIYKEEAFAIIGACFEVYNEMGCGFVEPVYHECLAMEFAHRGILFRSKAELTLSYKSRELEKKFEPDFICFEKIIVEIKALKELTNIEEAQALNYLRIARLSVGLLINFGTPSLQRKRFAMTHSR